MKPLLPIFAWVVLAAGPLSAQQKLTFRQAMEQTLANNFAIRQAKKDLRSAKTNHSRGAAGFYPRIDANGGLNQSLNNTTLEIADEPPRTVEQDWAATSNLTASLDLQWTLFDGMAMFYRYEKAGLQVELSKTQLTQQMEQKILDLANAYYQWASAHRTTETARQNLKLTQNRLKRLRTRQQFGQANQVEVLSAEVALNRDSVDLAEAQLNRKKARRRLRRIMAEESAADYRPAVDTTYRSLDPLPQLLSQAETHSTRILQAHKNLNLAQKETELAQAPYWPTITGNASYSYSRQNNEASLLLFQENDGPSFGLSLNYPLFSGFSRQRQQTQAEIGLEKSRLQLEDARAEVRRMMEDAYADLQHSKKVVRLQGKNLRTAKENFERSRELYNFGQLNGTRFREAQLNLRQARNSLHTARHQVKLNEIRLLQLSGQLVAPNPQ